MTYDEAAARAFIVEASQLPADTVQWAQVAHAAYMVACGVIPENGARLHEHLRGRDWDAIRAQHADLLPTKRTRSGRPIVRVEHLGAWISIFIGIPLHESQAYLDAEEAYQRSIGSVRVLESV